MEENTLGHGQNAGYQHFLGGCFLRVVNPFPKRQILDSSKLKEFADDNFDLMNWLVCCIGVQCHLNSEGHIIAVGDAYAFPGFLTPVLTQLFHPNPPTTFLTCFCRGDRQKYEFDENDKVLQTDKKHYGKKRNCSLRAISPFPTVF